MAGPAVIAGENEVVAARSITATGRPVKVGGAESAVAYPTARNGNSRPLSLQSPDCLR